MTANRTAGAAGGAYAVDDVEIAKPGACKVETWASFAGNQDFIGAFAPACVVDIIRPIEVGVAFARTRSDGAWGTSAVVKGKTNILPVETGKFGLAVAGGVGFDLLSGDTSNVFFVVPVTYQFSEQFRVNLNAGWLWDRIADEHFFTWGAGAEWVALTAPTRVTLIAEVFGLAGSGSNDPRFQAGIRFTPQEWFDIDVIYGRNIAGEKANWITLGVNVRFDVWTK